ncbi:glycosyltransferase [bacterium]|nr:glycosyltransferase [bacterium]MBU1983781.1 glycosyltransferase [bacterium]
MSDVVVIQWARLGDLLQTRVLLRRLMRKNATARRVLCADARYADLVRTFPEKFEFWPVDLRKWTAFARHPSSHDDLLRTLIAARRDSSGLSRPDVYVLTRSLTAVLFAERLSPRAIHGYQRRGADLVVPPAIGKIETALASGQPLPVHLADVWANLGESEANSSWLPALRIPRAANNCAAMRVGILCDSAEVYRDIPTAWLASLAKALVRIPAHVTLFGVSRGDEKNELTALSRHNPQQVDDLRGKTSLNDLLIHIAEQDTVIGADTGGLHLAAALGIFTVGLYFGGAHASHTGPYAANAVVVQNPSWDETPLRDIARLLENYGQRSASANIPVSSSVARAQLDAYGVVYSFDKSMRHVESSNSLCRREFFERFQAATETESCDGIVQQATVATVSVIIPECGVQHYTEELLGDLSRELQGIQAEILLVCSGESAARAVPKCDIPLACVRSADRCSYSVACNEGANRANYRYLFFLNNDTRIPDGKLRALLTDLRAGEVVSPVLHNADGTVQNCGVRFERGRIVELDHSAATSGAGESEVDAVSGVAMLVERDVFGKLGGFDERFANGYEDLDFCLRAAAIGVKCRVSRTAEIIHYRGSTPGRYDREDASRALFMKKWPHLAQCFGHKTVKSDGYEPVPLLIVSDLSAVSAGSVTRWVWPLEELGLIRGKDFEWIRTDQAQASQGAFGRALEAAATVIVFRPLSNVRVQSQIEETHAQTGFSLAVDFDDLVLGRFRAGSPRDMARREWEKRFRSLLARTDAISVSTESLAEQMRVAGFDTTCLPTRPWIMQQRHNRRSEREQNGVHVGFFGTPSHHVDLGSILPALERTLEALPSVRFYWWGCRPGDLMHHPQVRQGGPFIEEYTLHLRRLHHFGLDLAVVPLTDSPAARVKTAIKYYEYSLAGIPAVYSNTLPYSKIVRDGDTGLLASEATPDWIAKMSALIQDGDLRTQIATAAEKDVCSRMKDSLPREAFKILLVTLGISIRDANACRNDQVVRCPA